MLIKRIRDATRVLGKSQGYLGLPIRDVATVDKTTGVLVNRMVSAWELTPDEIDRLKQGATIYLHVMGTTHPPVMLEIGEPEL